MPYLHNYRLFISHKWIYSDGYQRIIQFINNAPNFQWSNYSVPESKAFEGMNTEQLKTQIRNQIQPVQCVIILAGMWVSYSDWIQYEIEQAQLFGKPILGIKPWGAERTPLAVSQAATEMVNWNSSSIVDAIRRITP